MKVRGGDPLTGTGVSPIIVEGQHIAASAARGEDSTSFACGGGDVSPYNS
jgi:hypothetical protein